MVAAAAAATLVLFAIGWPASIYQHGLADMPQFWLAPRTLLEGRTPYEVWDWPYPLWTAVALLPLGAVPLELAAPAWLVAQVAAVAVILAMIARRVLVTQPRRDAVVLAGLAIAMQPAWLLVGGGNMTGLLFAAFGGAVVARLAGQPILAGALLGLLVTKPMAFVVSAPVLIVAVRAGRLRTVIAAGVSAGSLIAASFVLRPAWLGAWIGNATALQTSTGSNATGWTIARAAPPLLPPEVTSALTIVGALAVLAFWWRVRRPDPMLLVAGAIPVSLYVAPHGWSYDQLHLLITYAVVLERLARLASAERVIGLVALALVAVVVPWALYARAFTTGGEELFAIVPVLAFALLVAADARAGARVRTMTGLVHPLARA